MVFLYFGRIHVKKGWRELCAAWEQLCAADPGFAAASQLVFCGSVDRSLDFEPQVTKLAGRFGNVVFAGPQRGASRWSSLIAADAVVLPSRSEGLPMAVLEAWAAGVPALMTSACNLPAGFEAGAAMELGPSAELIAAGLRAFFDLPPESRERMGQAGAELARRDFSLDAMESKLVELYRSCVAAQGNGCGSVVK
jgi:glycosyltransferase involved in cell wall biosynthesis